MSAFWNVFKLFKHRPGHRSWFRRSGMLLKMVYVITFLVIGCPYFWHWTICRSREQPAHCSRSNVLHSGSLYPLNRFWTFKLDGESKCVQVHAALSLVSGSVRDILVRYPVFKTSQVLIPASQLVHSVKGLLKLKTMFNWGPPIITNI